MNWKPRATPAPGDWKRVFAWWRVETECGHRAWLEIVERKKRHHRDGFDYVYRLVHPNPAQRAAQALIDREHTPCGV